MFSLQGMRRTKVNPSGGSSSAVPISSSSGAKHNSSAASKQHKGDKLVTSGKTPKKDHLTPDRVCVYSEHIVHNNFAGMSTFTAS